MPILLYYILIEQSLKVRLFLTAPKNFRAKTAAKVVHFFHIRKYFAKKACFLCFLAYLCNAKVANDGYRWSKITNKESKVESQKSKAAMDLIGQQLKTIKNYYDGLYRFTDLTD